MRSGVKSAAERVNSEPLECFVIMPVSDPEEYEPGHFQHVFEDIFRPACEKAGYRAIRADQVHETNLIHLDILQRLLQSPMVLCDLSSRNPNVLFELGLRQAFDKPVVLVQEVGTPKIFDIAPLRYTEYRRARVYHEVLEDQKGIEQAIRATQEAFSNGAGVNSVVRILSLTQPANLPDVQEANRDPVLQIIRAELSELRSEIRRSQYLAANIKQEDEGYPSDGALSLSTVVEQLEDRLMYMKNSGEIDVPLGEKITLGKGVLDRSLKYHAPDRIRPLVRRLTFLEQEYREITDRIREARERRLANLPPE